MKRYQAVAAADGGLPRGWLAYDDGRALTTLVARAVDASRGQVRTCSKTEKQKETRLCLKGSLRMLKLKPAGAQKRKGCSRMACNFGAQKRHQTLKPS